MFTPFISMVGVTGSMGPFFCEFTLNGDLLPVNYPATYAHELAHLLGITSEAEANFYAYQVCTRSQAMGIRFSGYFSVCPLLRKLFGIIRNRDAFYGIECICYFDRLYSPAFDCAIYLHQLYLPVEVLYLFSAGK